MVGSSELDRTLTNDLTGDFDIIHQNADIGLQVLTDDTRNVGSRVAWRRLFTVFSRPQI